MKKNGFTLIEILIVITIIGILASIAIPNYQDSVRKSKRAEAQKHLLELANYMERTFTENNSYIEATIAASGIINDNYTFTNPIPDLSVTKYTLTAVPKGAQASDTCGTLTLKQTGQKGAAISRCW